MIKIPQHVKNLSPYKAGKPIEELALEKGLKKIVKLASNENPLGPSPKAVEAIANHINSLHRYSSPKTLRLVNTIAEKYNKPPEEIIAASGSDSLIQYIVSTFSVEGDEVLSSEGTFIGWYVSTDKYDREAVAVPMNNYHIDLNGILQRITERTKIIYLANPNNPTGTMFTKTEFENFMSKVPKEVLVILDEAYTIYAEDIPGYPNGLMYNMENLIVLRTLSKAYGLAGLRAGFAVGPAYIIRELYKMRLPFEPNSLAQEAAIASFNDDEFLKKTIEMNKLSLTMMKDKFDAVGIRYIPTSANFYLLLFPNEEFAVRFNDECLNRGLILRHVKNFMIPNGIRINSGTKEETEFALKIIEEANCFVSENIIVS
jgi:histidinol-phosphate aminotransferase